MEFLPSALADYCSAHTDEESAILRKITRETHLKVLMPRMLSGHLQGRLLSMIAKMIRPKNILEIGTYTGYSAICLAEGLAENGKLTTIDINAELEDRVRGYFTEAGLSSKINYLIGDATQIIPTLNQTFDLVFIDADKKNNATYFDLLLDKIPSGGFILVDNVLWSGKVVGEKIDKDTQEIIRFNKKIQDDERVENVLLPIRDGIMLIRKR